MKSFFDTFFRVLAQVAQPRHASHGQWANALESGEGALQRARRELLGGATGDSVSVVHFLPSAGSPFWNVQAHQIDSPSPSAKKLKKEQGIPASMIQDAGEKQVIVNVVLYNNPKEGVWYWGLVELGELGNAGPSSLSVQEAYGNAADRALRRAGLLLDDYVAAAEDGRRIPPLIHEQAEHVSYFHQGILDRSKLKFLGTRPLKFEGVGRLETELLFDFFYWSGKPLVD